MARWSLPLLALLLACVLFAERSAAAEPPELILHSGKIVTVDAKFAIHEAIAIADGRILAVGNNEEILKLRGERTKVESLEGRMVMPGIIDSHTHPTGASMFEFDHPVPDMETIADVLAYVKSRTEAVEPGKWIWVSQVFITRLKEQRYRGPQAPRGVSHRARCLAQQPGIGTQRH